MEASAWPMGSPLGNSRSTSTAPQVLVDRSTSAFESKRIKVHLTDFQERTVDLSGSEILGSQDPASWDRSMDLSLRVSWYY